MLRVKLPNFREMEEVASYHEEPLRFYRMPFVRSVFIRRLKMAAGLLPPGRLHRILDAGYGSGALLPELHHRCDELFGIDTHNNHHLVERMLIREQIRATLRQGSVLDLPLEDSYFDAVVCMSVLEHIQDFRKAQKELVRVLRPGGILVVGVPVENRITDFLFQVIGVDNKHQHVSRYDMILETLKTELVPEERRKFPPFLPDGLSGYICARFRKAGGVPR